jgi:hypothetical protein
VQEQLAALYGEWLVPCVLQPLVGPQGAKAWGVGLLPQGKAEQLQQQQQQDVRLAYWRTVLLLYAAAVHQLGLAAVKTAIPDWHSVEVSHVVQGASHVVQGASHVVQGESCGARC